jgi:N-glycosylase/DNA lyase
LLVDSWSALPPHVLRLKAAHLNLAHTLDCGQAFRWRRDAAGWIGVIGRRVFRLERADAARIAWQARPDEPAALDELADYLRVDVDLDAVSAFLRERDPRMVEAIAGFAGLRVLAQPPQETLLTFVCTPASNVTRITRSIDQLARLYGDPIGTVGSETFHQFPSPETLAACDEGELMRTAGLGFRGENLRRVATVLALDRPIGWPIQLIGGDYEAARRELMALPSIGPKIADCIALFGLRADAAVPVDTHVWGLARELFGSRFHGRTLTPAVYEEVRAAFDERFGSWAGWAQQFLFHARRVGRALPMPSEVQLRRA